MDSLLGREEMIHNVWYSFIERENPLSVIQENIIINWSEEDPVVRYPIVAATISPFEKKENKEKLEWTPLAYKVINNSNDSIKILNIFKSFINPMYWNDSLADTMQQRLTLISEFNNHESVEISVWAKKEEWEFEQQIYDRREWEIERERKSNIGFEL